MLKLGILRDPSIPDPLPAGDSDSGAGSEPTETSAGSPGAGPDPPLPGSRSRGWGAGRYARRRGGRRLGWRSPVAIIGTLFSLAAAAIAIDLLTRSRLSATTTAQCQGDYGDSLQLESLRTRQTEQGPRGQYSYLVRSSARYECPFFGPDGKLRRKRLATSELGSAFAYEATATETYLLTNEHVASWPEVTDALHRVDGVPEGCKRVDDKLRIVRDERDDFEPGQVPLTRVAVDPLLDAAILKAPQVLNVLPYRVGKSASLRQGNAIRVRTYERGVEGETLACGTGVTASALISSQLHGLKSPIDVQVQSGDHLQVSFDQSGSQLSNVRLTGPAEFVFEGEIELGDG